MDTWLCPSDGYVAGVHQHRNRREDSTDREEHQLHPNMLQRCGMGAGFCQRTLMYALLFFYMFNNSHDEILVPTLSYEDLSAVSRAVTTAAQGINQHLLQLLFDKFNLAQHINAIKRYLLLGQGDFIQVQLFAKNSC